MWCCGGDERVLSYIVGSRVAMENPHVRVDSIGEDLSRPCAVTVDCNVREREAVK